MINLIKIETGDFFDLPLDFELSIELNSPLFGGDASYSLPSSLPDTNKNLNLLGLPNRLDYNPSEKMIKTDVALVAGVVNLMGTLCVLSYSHGVIECSIIFDASTIRGKIKDKTLKEVFEDNILCDYSDEQNSVSKVVQWIEQSDVVGNEKKVGCFPVACKDYLLNPVYVTNQRPQSGFWPLLSRFGNITQVDSEGRSIKGEIGYFTTPFLTLGYIVKMLCQYCGFSLQESNNVFYTDENLKKIHLLNNTVDSCMAGKLRMKDLVPDIKATDFIDELFNVFGVGIIITNGVAKTVMLNTVIADNNIDCSLFGRVERKVVSYKFSDPMNLCMKCAGALIEDKAVIGEQKIVEVESYQAYLATERGSTEYTCYYMPIPVGGISDWFAARKNPNTPYSGRLAYNRFQYDCFATPYNGQLFAHCFNHIPESRFENKIIDSKMKGYSCVNRSLDGVNYKTIPYVGEHRNCVVNAVYTDSEGNKTDVSKDTECPLLFAYRCSPFGSPSGTGYESRLPYGSNCIAKMNEPYAIYHREGAGWYTDDCYTGLGNNLIEELRPLSPHYLCPEYHFYYARLLAAGMHTISTKIHLSSAEFMSMSFAKKYRIENRICIPSQIKAVISGRGIDINNIDFITL